MIKEYILIFNVLRCLKLQETNNFSDLHKTYLNVKKNSWHNINHIIITLNFIIVDTYMWNRRPICILNRVYYINRPGYLRKINKEKVFSRRDRTYVPCWRRNRLIGRAILLSNVRVKQIDFKRINGFILNPKFILLEMLF